MAQLAGVCQYFRQLIAGPPDEEFSDCALLRRFVGKRDESAFAMLLERHGPMVMRVCRQVLQHAADAEDAFQATFLVLARHAQSVRKGESLSGWLYRVAFHIAVQTRGRAANRLKHEKQVASMQQETAPTDLELQEFLPVVHEEINGLPPQYRTPIVLCYLQGLSNEEAAQQLNCPVGTVKTRLSRGRDLLRGRLARRGVEMTAVLLAALLTQGTAAAAVSATLTASTLKAALLVAAGESAPVSATVWALVEGAHQALFVNQLKVAAALIASFAVVVVGLGAVALSQPGQPNPEPLHLRIDQAALADASGIWSQESAIRNQESGVRSQESGIRSQDAGFKSVITVYPNQATGHVTSTGPASSRQDALSGQALNDRPNQYQARLEEHRLSQLQAKQTNQSAELLPMPAVVGSEEPNKPWWEWVWVPW